MSLPTFVQDTMDLPSLARYTMAERLLLKTYVCLSRPPPDLDSQVLFSNLNISQRWNPKTFVAWRPRLAAEPLVKIVDEVRDLEGKPLMTPRLSQLWQVEAS